MIWEIGFRGDLAIADINNINVSEVHRVFGADLADGVNDGDAIFSFNDDMWCPSINADDHFVSDEDY